MATGPRTPSAIPIEQALFGRDGCRARSSGFRDDWLPDAERLCTSFGERPAGVACPACVFAQPLGKGHVAVVQVADQYSGLGFHLLVLPRFAYAGLGGDPFALVERFPPPWQARGELPSLSVPAESPPRRTVEHVQHVLQRAEGPSLLGGAQALLDGGRLAFVRPAPDTPLLRDLWTLLPASTRWQLWPASFAFGNALRFHALVMPHAGGEETADYLTEDQAAEYPEGRYELSLQVAAENGDQPGLDALFNRRSRAETWRLGLILLCFLLVLVLAMNWLNATVAPARKAPAPAQEQKEGHGR